ncbi:maleylpyruvate isomerase family mycothiol-dependent enzyme [soil metagenome]
MPWKDADVPTHLSFEQHLSGFREAMRAMCRYADRAGLDVDVPPCPEWTVRRLIGHQGMIHRWARANLRGESIEVEATEKAGRSHADPVDWLRDGAIDLVTTLVAAAPDVDALVFLHDAPPARLFWARRQHHETTMHAVDTLAAAHGRLPTAAETWISPEVALDGIDELVLGFVPRSKSQLRVGAGEAPVTIAIRPTDAEHSYTVRVTEAPPVVARVDGRADGDLVVEAPSAPLYLALWHRTDEVSSDIWPLWRGSAIT